MLVKVLTSLSLGFLLGITIHSLWMEISFSLVWMIVLCVIAVVLTFTSQNKYLVYISFIIIGIAFGLFRFSTNIDTRASQIFDVFVDNQETIMIHGVVVSEPIKHISYTEFVVETDELVTHGQETIQAETAILVRADTYTDYEYGQEVVVKGSLTKPSSFITDTDREFDYQSYLYKDKIYYIMSYAEAMIFEEGNMSIQRSLYQLKQQFLKHIYRIIPEPESGLLAGVLFGEKSALDETTEEKFRIVGLMHIVVLSGYNVSLVIQVFMRILHFLPRIAKSIIAVGAIAGFALLVGAGPTVIRASIMAVFIVLAEVLHARYDIIRALFVAGLIMVIANPMILIFDISFQLSFLATYGLIQFSPYLEKKFTWIPHWFAMRESAVATIAAQIMVLPLLLYAIGELSIISPIVNVLVLFAVPYSMAIGFGTAIFSMISADVASIGGVITTYLLKYQLWIVDVFASLPFSHIILPPFHISFMFFGYLIIFWWIRNIKKNENLLTEKL